MVDPNRKINRLTEKDIEFLDECEEEFADRFTDEDTEFMAHCSKPLAEPPIVENWGFSGVNNHHNNRGGRDGGGQRNQHHHHHDGNRYNRGGWNRRGRGGGGGGGGDRGYRNHNHNRRSGYRPYDTQHRGGRDYESGRSGRSDDRQHPPMNIRRDYGNFVPASQD